MDAPIWTNDLVYLQQMILTMVVTAVIIGVCFYLSKRSDRRYVMRAARGARPMPTDQSPPEPSERRDDTIALP
jgi:hypothetical protein